MFNEYNPINNKEFQVLDHKGKVVAKDMMPAIKDDDLLKAYKDMLFARTQTFRLYHIKGRVEYTPILQLWSGGYLRSCRNIDKR